MKVNTPYRLGVRQCGNCLEVRSFYIALWQRKYFDIILGSTQMHIFNSTHYGWYSFVWLLPLDTKKSCLRVQNKHKYIQFGVRRTNLSKFQVSGFRIHE